jgi:transposase
MAHKYSEDLKEQAVKYVEAGHSYRSASVIFGSTATTIKCWYKKYLLLGHVRTQKRLGKKPRVSNEEFIKYVELHPDETLKQIGAYFDMTDVGALYYMRKTGISYKKKSLATEKRVQKKDTNTYLK